tara:strand:+ start:1239 stop:1754 length:516 start_codon:yes stop_codon:yes gene_type:complete
MFTQSAFSDLDEAERQTIAYFQGLTVTRSWPDSVVEGLTTWVSAVARNNRSILGWIPLVAAYQYAEGEAADEFWKQIAEEFPTEIGRLTNNDPDSLSGVNSVATTLGAGAVASFSIEQGTGISGAMNIAQESLDEFVVEQQKRNEQWEKWAPFALPVIGLAAIFVTIKALK